MTTLTPVQFIGLLLIAGAFCVAWLANRGYDPFPQKDAGYPIRQGVEGMARRVERQQMHKPVLVRRVRS